MYAKSVIGINQLAYKEHCNTTMALVAVNIIASGGWMMM